MKKIKYFIFGVFLLIFLMEIVSATTASFPSVCCEKTKTGAFCINTNQNECALGFRTSPSSCSQTSYCREGTCYDSFEGICLENVPQLVCNAQNGTWINKPIEQVPQCQLGCCIIAEQASFVSLVRCKRLSSYYGVSIDFRTDIEDESSCIATAQSQDTGACVFEKDFDKTCTFTTRAECNAPDGIVGEGESSTTDSSEKRFYKDYLCSAEELGTNCARQSETRCYQNKVYWYDSCGNRENIYSSDKDKSWNNGKDIKDDVLNPVLSNGNNLDNGNCDYLQGARCAEYASVIGGPSYGNYYCKRTECKLSQYGKTILGVNRDRKNGESWCMYDFLVGNGLDSAGSRHFRYMCVDGEIQVDACDDYRARICFQNTDIQAGSGVFSTAACRVNRWQDCLFQTKEEKCNNTDVRECIWMNSVSGLTIGTSSTASSASNTAFSNPTTAGNSFTGNVVAPITGNSLLGGDEETEEETTTNRPDGVCVPSYPPGLHFWENGEASSICGQASATCYVIYEKKGKWFAEGDWECTDNCECLSDQWAANMNKICSAMGDCGGGINWYSKNKFTDEGYEWTFEGVSKQFNANTKNIIVSGLTGNTIGVDIVQNLGGES